MDAPKVKKNKKSTSISFYTMNEKVETMVRDELERTFGKKNSPMISNDIIYTCVKELMVNASKTNIKKTFFIEAKIDENDRETYNIAKKNVRKLWREHCLPYMQEKLKKHNQKVEVSIEERAKGIILTVKNPMPLLDDEEERIRETFRLAMQNDTSDIALFYTEDDDHKEGAGLGLLLVVNLLKLMGINPAYFRMGVIKDNTVARIEIPLSNDYISIRD
jgi:hypothetical protein